MPTRRRNGLLKPMRWIVYAVGYLSLVVALFCWYGWQHRNELLSRAFERYSGMQSVAIESISCPDYKTVVLKNIRFGKDCRIHKVRLSGNWLLWAFSPTATMLRFESADIFTDAGTVIPPQSLAQIDEMRVHFMPPAASTEPSE